MKRTNKPIAIVFLLILVSIATSCADKDVYDPDASRNKLPPAEEYFGFETRADINLNVDYAAPGFKAIIEVYDQNPLNEDGLKKEGLIPVYTAYTTADATFSGKMRIPTAVEEAYLYTDCWGLPQCVKLKATAGGFEYDANASSVSQTRAGYTDYFTGNAPYDLRKGPGSSASRGDNLYSICKWGVNGKPESGFLTNTPSIGGSNVAALNARIQKVFDKNVGSNKQFLKSPEVMNITTPSGGAELDVVFLSERAAFRNVLGYYYYKVEKEPWDNTDVAEFKKFIVFPNCSMEDGVLRAGETARLKFYGDSGTDAPLDRFPEGYVVGWFFMSNGFCIDDSSYGPNTIFEGGLPGPNIGSLFTSDERNRGDIWGGNKGRDDRRFVALQDAASEVLVFGFEDQVTVNEKTEDYSDVLFAVVSDADLSNPDRPVIPDDKPEEKPGKDIIEGTLAFEDIWPHGGDYDLNDVIVEYSRAISFNGQNKATEVEETFTYVHKAGSATIESIFAYQVNELGEVKTKPDGVLEEAATKSIVINEIAKNSIGKSYTIVRDLKGQVDKDAVRENFNPYIIIGGYSTANRTEVHLPKQAPTSFTNKELIGSGDDAYYVDKEGKFPFAIDIPVHQFEPATERVRIDSDGEYPAFAKWAESNGADNKDWYKQGKAADK